VANRYWVGGTGTWDQSSTANWSTVSGGSSGASAPTYLDNAYLDANSGGGVIDLQDDGAPTFPSCKDLICTGFTGSIENTGLQLTVSGNVTLSSGGDYSLFFIEVLGNCTFTSVGRPIYDVDIRESATLTLADAVTDAVFIFNVGTFITNNFNVTTAYYTSLSGTVNMGSSTFTVTGDWSIDAGSTVNAGTSTINLTNTSSLNFYGGGKTYYNLNAGGTASVTVYGNNTFNTISNSTQPVTVTFAAGSTQTVTNFSVSGTAGNLVTLNSNTPGTRFSLSKASGTVSRNYLSIQDSNATGGAAWYAGTNSTNVSNNLGWTFTAPPTPGGATVIIGAGWSIGPGWHVMN